MTKRRVKIEDEYQMIKPIRNLQEIMITGWVYEIYIH